jgi:large subunit ribosomal protein L21
MKKAIISTGGKQYLVKEGDEIEIEFLKADKSINFDALLVTDDTKTIVGKPIVKDIKVSANVLEQEVKADKITSIRYKAKKRVKKVRGHRQLHTIIKITKIA